MHFDEGFLDECLEYARELFSESEFRMFHGVDGMASQAVRILHVETSAEVIVDTYPNLKANYLLALLRLGPQVQDHPGVNEPTSMRYSMEFLSQPDVLLRALAVPLRSQTERALFVGVYGKRHFNNLAAFVSFTRNVSSITQEWYSTGDLERAYEYYYPPDAEREDEGAKWLEASNTVESKLVDWLQDLGVDVDMDRVPIELGGLLHWRGDVEEFGLIAEMDDCYFEVFIADL